MLGDSDDPGNNGVPGVQINPGGAHSQTGVTGGARDKSGKSEYEYGSLSVSVSVRTQERDFANKQQHHVLIVLFSTRARGQRGH